MKQSSFEFIEHFCCLLGEELKYQKEKVQDYLAIQSYYKNLFHEGDRLLSVGVLGYADNLLTMVDEISKLPRPVRILDAGCGYGTESLLFSILGCEVTGIDLVPERIDIARRRVKFYQERFDFPLPVRFIPSNIFRFLDKSDTFDIIWVMQAISHIYPAQRFLRAAHRRLKDGGKLIITDPNLLNPISLLRAIRIRGSFRHVTHSRFRDPDSGRPVEYGQEKIFSVLHMKKIMTRTGFRVEKIDMLGFMGSTFLPGPLLEKEGVSRALFKFQAVLRRAPLIRLFGSIYVIVASKQ